MAIEHDNLVRYLMESYMADKEAGHGYDFLMENPVGSLRHRPYMQGERIEECVKRKTVDYCAFELPYKKSTDLSLDIIEALATNRQYRQCQMQRWTLQARDEEEQRPLEPSTEDRRSSTPAAQRTYKGPSVKKLLWRLPQKLTHEFTEQLKQTQMKSDQKVVIDFFSGEESWKAAVEEAGYIYLPVDVRTLTTPTVINSAG